MSSDEEVTRWHAHFGAEAYNAAWELIDQPDRTPDDAVDMLASAAASRWHKTHLGRPDLMSMGEWQLAHVASLMGLAELAVTCARRNLAIAEELRWDGWRLASAHEGMARAAAAAGDVAARELHIEAATAALGREPEEDERGVIQGQLDTVPQI